VLLKGIRTGEIMAYEKDMSTVMPKAKLDSEYAQQVAYYGIKEEWIFDRNQGQMAVHILALTPMVADSGSYKELFWLVYPDNTLFLSQHVVQNANNKANGMTWDAYFESRLFSSRITRIDHDKPANKKRKAEVIEDVTGLQELRQTWPKD
jgi:hypothetical protein